MGNSSLNLALQILIVLLLLVILAGQFYLKSNLGSVTKNAAVSKLEPRNHYFATTEDGRLVRMTPLSESNLSGEEISEWAQQTLLNIIDFNEANYKRKLDSASKSFTKRGWESFTRWLQSYRVIELMNAGSFSYIFSELVSEPKIVDVKVEGSRKLWVVDMKLNLKVDKGQIHQKVNVQVMVVRSTRIESELGISIEKISFKALKNEPR